MVVGIVVLWDKARAKKTLEDFLWLMRRIGREFSIFAVCNNHEIEVDVEGVDVIRWDYTLHEFGAWDFALQSLGPDVRRRVSMVIFANDTFSHHRPWGWGERAAFLIGFRGALKRKLTFIGATSSFGHEFYLRGCYMHEWVSTYLFAITADLMDQLNWEIKADRSVLDACVKGGGKEESFFGNELDSTLKEHLCGGYSDGRVIDAGTELLPGSSER
jgi:hypothetical protein